MAYTGTFILCASLAVIRLPDLVFAVVIMTASAKAAIIRFLAEKFFTAGDVPGLDVYKRQSLYLVFRLPQPHQVVFPDQL